MDVPENEKSDERRGVDGEDGAGYKKLKTDDGSWSPRHKIARSDNANEIDNNDHSAVSDTAPSEVKEVNYDLLESTANVLQEVKEGNYDLVESTGNVLQKVKEENYDLVESTANVLQEVKEVNYDLVESTANVLQEVKKVNYDLVESTANALQEVIEENVDSGISGDKSESEDRATENPTDREPGNSVVEAGPSSSTIAVIFNLKKPIGSRNYRRNWKSRVLNGGVLSDDSMSDIDSDDVSMEAAGERVTVAEDNPRPIVEDNIRSHTPRSDDARSENRSTSADNTSRHSANSSSSASTDSDLMQRDDSDSDEWTDPETARDNANEEYETPSALLKSKPKHVWFITKELRNREMGLTLRPGVSGKSDAVFEQRYHGSLHAVHRLELMYKLERHKGCVNAINFHPEGQLLASGSDDLNVVVWDWATETPRQILKTGHKSNVFQSRFLFLNARSQLNIATCARDGQVRLLQCPPSGAAASVVRRRLMTHTRSAHKLHLTAAEPHVVLSCGEDGLVQMADVRSDHPTKLFTVKERGSSVPLFSIHGHPLEPRELVVAGRNSHVRVYDRRKPSKPLASYCPSYLTEMENRPKRRNSNYLNLYVTCAVYNHDGSEILASYNDDDIYLFDVAADKHEKDSKKEGYTHRYSGHRNNTTFKGVNFFGPRSEFIVSGSDCSYIYMWEKKTEAIVQWMPGDEGGVVNCIESHPRCPVMASSGIDKDVKIWVPSNEEDPRYAGLTEVVKENAKAQLRSPFLEGFFPTFYSRFNRHADFAEGDDSPRNLLDGINDFDGQVCTTF